MTIEERQEWLINLLGAEPYDVPWQKILARAVEAEIIEARLDEHYAYCEDCTKDFKCVRYVQLQGQKKSIPS